MKMLEYVVSARAREIIYNNVKEQMASQLHANATRDRSSFRVRPSSNTCATIEFAYSDRYVYVGELESSNPRARYDLPFPHFIDPPCYTNKLVAPPRLPTPKESYPDTTGRSSLLSFCRFGNR